MQKRGPISPVRRQSDQRVEPARKETSSGVRRAIACALVLVFAVTAAAGQSSGDSIVARGEDAYLNNKPQEAVALLGQAVQEQPNNARIYHYLGVSHQQLGQHERAVEIMREGVTKNAPPELRSSLYLNIGNSLYQLGNFSAARDAYGQAISLRSSFARPYLNRANATVALFKEQESGQERMDAFKQAIQDYQRYLSLQPETGQRTRIERMISLLQGEADETEQRLAEERRREQEARERRQRMVDSVLDSLNSAREQTRSKSAGQEGLDQYEEELDIAD